MVLRVLLVAALILLGALGTPSAYAHKDHERQKAEQAAASSATIAHKMSPEVHQAVKDDLVRLEAQAAGPWPVRLVDWIGRTHPFAVHFPLALFPVAWIALVLARRRGASQPLLGAIIIVAGASAVIASALGWLNGGFVLVDADPLHRWHRWLGTILGIVGLAVASWVWRRPDAGRSRLMVWTLGAVALLLLVQGWMGGALVHGVDHLNW